MIRSIVLALVLAALCSPAEALQLVFTDQPQVTLPTNGGFWVRGHEELRECDLSLRRGKEKIRLDVIRTTDRDREFGAPIHFLLPREALDTGRAYYMRYRCPGRVPWTLTNSSASHGVPEVAFHGTGDEDLVAPRWTSEPVNLWQAPLCPICGQSTTELALGFTMPVEDQSPMRIQAVFSKTGSDEPSFSSTLIDGRFDIETSNEQMEWPLETGGCYSVVFCATDSSGNESCSAAQPFVREVQSCWADRSVSSDPTQISGEVRDLWCAAPAMESPPLPELTSSGLDSHRVALLLGSCVFLLLLLQRIRQARRAKTRLGRFGPDTSG